MEYKEDILHGEFQQQTFELKDDYEGKVVSTLVRRLSPDATKAVLYIHGFNDYFFQEEMALKFCEQGFNFYALDLRKYGRSYLPHQKFNDVRNLRSYYEEISLALQSINFECNSRVILTGHSTGGLIATLYAKEHNNSILFDGLILNSPFFKFNIDPLSRLMLPIISCLGRFLPNIKISGGFTELYGKMLHKNYGGRWDYDLAWKPNVAPKVNMGWVRAIYKAQRELRKSFSVTIPTLVLHSEKSSRNPQNNTEAQTRDIILNVKDIHEISKNIKGDVTKVAIPGGIHDLVLSSPEVSENVYQTIFNWTAEKGM